ncbi:hypothetical protein, conserved [Babesia bigemina]|uniref:Uncharacterized protein n=1 Tax=Babesia bigemina TaxID=5866 RepID=A0A061D7P9_BABBI|nr:hypothetical protein, conserved [Babesia bigemina]CDR96017.1 hypothetical protein, conserved [Babesia bigemina]|eukprot:XP_012768203.1 hypothetical protein, conserved [Babesia bigemina]
MHYILHENGGGVGTRNRDAAGVYRLQGAVDAAHKNIAELHHCTRALAETLNRSHECLEELLTLLPQCGVETDMQPQLCGAKSAKELNYQSLREASDTTRALCHKLRGFSDMHLEKALDKIQEFAVTDTPERPNLPVMIGDRPMTPNELIYTLNEAPMVSVAHHDREACLRKNITQAHYELASSKVAYKQLLQCSELPPSGSYIIQMAGDRIERTLRILSRSIRELIAIDPAYQDFFYAYLTETENKEKEHSSEYAVVHRIDSQAIKSMLSSQGGKGNGGVAKMYEKQLHECATTMGSLMQEFIRSFSPNTPTEPTDDLSVQEMLM